MDLLDLIGDTRTDSLPAGFLRSVKMKYKQESSRVLPPGTPYNKGSEGGEHCKRAGSAASIQSTPSFMSWKIPQRLIHCNSATRLPHTPLPGTGLDMERTKLSSRLSIPSRASVGSHKLPVSQEKLYSGRQTLPKLHSSHSVRSVASSGKPMHESLPAVGNQPHERRITNKIPGKDLKVIEKAMNPNTHANATEAVTKWLQTATDKEKAIALKFFSSLSDAEPEKPDKSSKKLHNHMEGECEMCDTERIEKTLQALARDGATVPKGKLQYNPRRKPDLSRQSHYHTPKCLPPHVRQQFQTWHHLPIYTVPRDAAINKSSMFTQPHRDYGRHFSIHPEWGLHKPLVL